MAGCGVCERVGFLGGVVGRDGSVGLVEGLCILGRAACAGDLES